MNSEKHKISDHNLSKRNAHYRTNDTSKFNHGSLHRLSKSFGVHEDISIEAKSHQDGLNSKFYRTSYVDVRYYVDTDASKASILDTNSTKYEVKNESHFTDVATTEIATTRRPLNISVDRIINVPKRKCPGGQRMDLFGTCKTVWNT